MDDEEAIEKWGEARLDWLRRFVPLDGRGKRCLLDNAYTGDLIPKGERLMADGMVLCRRQAVALAAKRIADLGMCR